MADLFPLSSGCLLMLATISCGYMDLHQRSKQVRTFADLQTISTNIEQQRSMMGQLTSQSVEAVMTSVSDGRDAWDRRFAYDIQSYDDGKTSYVILSFGQDGVLDVNDIDEYFQMEPESVAGNFVRDIVFRDGRPILNAGK